MRGHKHIAVLLLAIIALVSCKSSVEITRRKYRKGFYVQAKRKTHSNLYQQTGFLHKKEKKNFSLKKLVAVQEDLTDRITADSSNTLPETLPFDFQENQPQKLTASSTGETIAVSPVSLLLSYNITPTDEYYSAYTPPQTETNALLSFIFGLATWGFAIGGILIPYIGGLAILCAILAIVFGVIAKNKLRNDVTLEGKTYANIGIALGIIYIVLLALLIFLIIMLILAFI